MRSEFVHWFILSGRTARSKYAHRFRKFLLPVLDESFANRIKSVEEIILAEVNVKAIQYIDDASGVLVKKVKPNFAKLGKQYGPKMKEVSAVINTFTKKILQHSKNRVNFPKDGFDLVLEDVLISSEDIPGWSVATEGTSNGCAGYYHYGRTEKRRYCP